MEPVQEGRTRSLRAVDGGRPSGAELGAECGLVVRRMDEVEPTTRRSECKPAGFQLMLLDYARGLLDDIIEGRRDATPALLQAVLEVVWAARQG